MSSRTDQRTVLMVGNYLPSLAVARALSAAGFRVIAGDGGDYEALVASRHCEEVWHHPPIREKGRFIDALTAFLAERPDVTIVLPVVEDSVKLFAENRRPLPDRVTLAMTRAETVSTCLDKLEMYAVAARADVPYLPMAKVTDRESLVEACERIGYPVIIRPTGKEDRPDPTGSKASICASEGEAVLACDQWQTATRALLVQRYVQAPRNNVYFAARAGQVLAWTESRVLWTDKPDGTGVNVEAVSVEPDLRLTRWTEALVRDLDYTGVGLAQYLMPEEHEPYFIELNPRLGAGVALPQGLGLDLAVGVCELASPESTWVPDRRCAQRIGKRYAWTSGATRGLLAARQRGELTNGQTLRWLARTGISALRADFHATWSVRDPKPALVIVSRFLRSGMSGLRGSTPPGGPPSSHIGR